MYGDLRPVHNIYDGCFSLFLRFLFYFVLLICDGGMLFDYIVILWKRKKNKTFKILVDDFGVDDRMIYVCWCTYIIPVFKHFLFSPIQVYIRYLETKFRESRSIYSEYQIKWNAKFTPVFNIWFLFCRCCCCCCCSCCWFKPSASHFLFLKYLQKLLI